MALPAGTRLSTTPRVTAIVLSWNGRERTLACIRSLGTVTYRPFSILVVDNGSHDGSADAVALEHPDVGLVRLDENLGFAGGMNAGIQEAIARGTDAVLLLNNDMEVEPGSVVFSFGKVTVDFTTRSVLRNGEIVHLTPIEYRLLGVLIANVGRVLTHRALLREVWGPSHSERTHYLRVYMGQLRQKLEDAPAQPRHILTETGVGYRMMGE